MKTYDSEQYLKLIIKLYGRTTFFSFFRINFKNQTIDWNRRHSALGGIFEKYVVFLGRSEKLQMKMRYVLEHLNSKNTFEGQKKILI